MEGQSLPIAKVGFIGLGKMGDPMARRLVNAGFSVHVFDSDRSRIDRFLSTNKAEASGSLEDLTRQCEAVITMLPNGNVVREVVLGKTGVGGSALLPGLARGSILVDMSSSSPVGTRELGRQLSERGIPMVDAPVSGGVRKAEDGTLAIMAGGDPAVIERCRGMLSAMGRQIFLTGPLGSGHAMKALNNYVSAAGLLAASEALMAGKRFGLDPGVIISILNASSGRNNSTENKFNQFILSRTFASGFSLGLMAKDIRIAMEVADATGTHTPLGIRCMEVWRDAESKLGSSSDHTEVIRYLEEIMSESL